MLMRCRVNIMRCAVIREAVESRGSCLRGSENSKDCDILRGGGGGGGCEYL